VPTILRPAEPKEAEFLGWACVAAARSQLARGWFEIVLQRDDDAYHARESALLVALVAVSRRGGRRRSGIGHVRLW